MSVIKLVYDTRFNDSTYADDNAALPGRMEALMGGFTAGLADGSMELVKPVAASLKQLLLAHGINYVEDVAIDRKRFAMASLAVGAAIFAGELAMSGAPAFACIRPPGHHASAGMSWGHCTFNNIAITLLSLRRQKLIESAFVLDFDAHTGDGTRTLLHDWKEAQVFNPYAETAAEYLALVEEVLAGTAQADIIAVSAGFDAYIHDVGHKLQTADFAHLGKLAKDAAHRLCRGRRFAVLEGGYYLPDLGKNAAAFCAGFGE